MKRQGRGNRRKDKKREEWRGLVKEYRGEEQGMESQGKERNEKEEENYSTYSAYSHSTPAMSIKGGCGRRGRSWPVMPSSFTGDSLSLNDCCEET